MKFRINRIQVAAFVLAGIAAAILGVEYVKDTRFTLQSMFGIEPYLGNVPIGVAIAILAGMVYVVGRAVDIWERHRDQFRRPPRR